MSLHLEGFFLGGRNPTVLSIVVHFLPLSFVWTDGQIGRIGGCFDTLLEESAVIVS